jgi:predicted RNA-binding protein (virulence factor B family)
MMDLLAGDFYSLKVEAIDATQYILTGNIPLAIDKSTPKARIGEVLQVFLYHNGQTELVATLVQPKAKVGDLVTLKVKEISTAGAFLDWGLPKDLLIPRSFHEDDLEAGELCLVKVLRDARDGRVYAKEKLEGEISNEVLTVKEKESVEMHVYKQTDIGYQMIINGKHLGILHNNEVFKELYAGDKVSGFIKKIKPDNKIDVVLGKLGHTRVEDEAQVILNALQANKGFLPYHDKSSAEEIIRVFGMSKRTFKMTLGGLYKQKRIVLSEEGIRLVGK